MSLRQIDTLETLFAGLAEQFIGIGREGILKKNPFASRRKGVLFRGSIEVKLPYSHMIHGTIGARRLRFVEVEAKLQSDNQYLYDLTAIEIKRIEADFVKHID